MLFLRPSVLFSNGRVREKLDLLMTGFLWREQKKSPDFEGLSGKGQRSAFSFRKASYLGNVVTCGVEKCWCQ